MSNLSGQWYASQVASPFAVALPDGVVRVVNQNYALKSPLHTIESYSLKRYTGLGLGDRVTVIGTVTHAAGGTAVQARIVAGGTRADYVAERRGSVAAPLEVAVLCALLLVAPGPGLWLMRRQLQRYTPAAI